MRYLILIIFSIFLLSSCTNDDNAPINESISFTTIGKNTLHGDENITQSNLVVTSNSEWLSLIDQMNSVNNISSTFIETDIDFDNFMLIVVISEIKTSGAEITITDIVENPTHLIVDSQELIFSTTVISQPFHIVKLPKSEKPVIFQ